LAGIGQAIPDLPGTEIIFESTANSIGNMFYNKVQDAIRGIGDYILVFIPWFWQDEYASDDLAVLDLTPEEEDYQQLHVLSNRQMAWRAKKIVNDFSGDVDLFNQEYPATPTLAFMANTSESYLPMPLINKAMIEKDLPISTTAAVILGVDPAEYGEDATAYCLRIGRVVPWVKRKYKKGTMEVVGIIAKEADEIKRKYGRLDAINIDCTGIGSGIADRLLELKYPVNRIHFGGSAFEDEIYYRQKDELYGGCKAWLEDQPNQLPKDEALMADMIAAKYSYNSSRALIIESKEKMRKRGLKSPDSCDALVLTHAIPIMHTNIDQRDLKVAGFRVGTHG
jgi:phage FluMu gp28-like protein